MYLICWDICAHLPPIGRHSTSCFYWEKTHQSTWVMLMRSFGCRSRASDSTLCISASEFDNGMLAFGLMKVTISRRWLNASLVSKILSTRFALSDGLAIEKAFDKERSTKDCCNRLWNFWMNPTINLNANSFDLLWHLACATNWKMQLVSCDLRHWAHAANREAQLDLWWSNFAASWGHCTSHLYWKCTHHSTERWVEFRGFLKYQLTVASPLWRSMLCLASWFICWSYKLKWKQCEGMAWNCLCWRYLDFYCKRLNPTWQFTKWADSREGYMGRWETSLACQVRVCSLRACRALIMIHECCVRVH